jgi:FHS family L-fucose permease-like MFS transporter
VLGSYVFFDETADDVESLRSVQWVYLAIAIFVFLLAGVFFVSNIPEVTDADMQFQVDQTHIGDEDKPFWKRYQLFHATFAQFMYVGAQGTLGSPLFQSSILPYLTSQPRTVAIAGYFINYAVETRPNTSSALGAKLLAGAQAAFTVGRFSGTLFMKFVRPRWVFLVYLSGVIAFLAASTTQRGNTGICKLHSFTSLILCLAMLTIR